jgi:DNA helicase-2/ATP-dependent DNA helicase PcrA
MASELPHPELARQLLDESGYTGDVAGEKSVEAAGRLENLSELVRAMEEYESLGAFLEHVSLVMEREGGEHVPQVTIMTIHAAKGLEFDTVFLAGWEEGLFPSQRALDEGGTRSLEEERRLAYVAITRARRKAVILHAANRRIYGQWTSSIPSRFVGELPPEHIEAETSMSGGESLWRANWSEHADPFAAIGRGTGRGPGWQRAAGTLDAKSPGGGWTARTFTREPARIVESRAPSVSLGNKGRSDLSVGQRVFHQKFGYGEIAEIEGNKLEIDFDQAGRKRVMDSFVTAG